ncbi:hypothetical protein [Halocatena halophila]|uniref:hypothetical protein n=1 Tax=Halocatena halophila TaxID=2814576 RepID=UPI002ED1036E
MILRAGGGSSTSVSAEQSSFLLSGPVTFAPYYVPERISIDKERKLDKSDNFCGGQDVIDTGSKNRVIHISGKLRANEVGAFNGSLNKNEPFDVVTPAWSGQVRIEAGELEGPIGYDPINKMQLYSYSLDIVSTGIDEGGGQVPKFGIISG